MSIESRHIIDISTPLMEGVPVWPGSPGIRLKWFKRVEKGQGANLSELSMDVHIGTHVEGKLHNFTQGESVDQFPLDVLIGPAIVVYLPEVEAITAEALEEMFRGSTSKHERVLFRTRNSAFWREPVFPFREDFVGIAPDGAEWLIAHGVKLVGIDYLSIASFGKGHEVHDILLTGGALIIEGLNLDGVEPGEYELFCAPLKLMGREAAPARAILRALR